MEEFRFTLPTEQCVTIDNLRVSMLTEHGQNREGYSLQSLHTHSYVEIFICTEGVLTIVSEKGQQHAIKGCGILVPPHVLHHLMPSEAPMQRMTFGLSMTRTAGGSRDLYTHFMKRFCGSTPVGLTGCTRLIFTAEDRRLNGEAALELTLDKLCLRDDSMDQLRGEHTVYYTDATHRYLIGQSIPTDLTNREDLPALLLEQMRTPPEGTRLHSLIPQGTLLRSVTLDDGVCSIDLSQAFVSNRFYSHTEQLLTLNGIVNTLCGISQIRRVEFSVEGDLLLHYGALSISGALLPDERSLGPVRTGLGELEATVYLAHGEQPGLYPVPVRLQQTAGLSQAALVMRLLLKDTGVNDLQTRIPAGTQLNSIRVERRICHVDLSEEFLDHADPTWAIRVITASLCALDGISAVHITVNGTVPAGYDPNLFGVLTPKDAWFL
jgi:germination protein M